jgi:hypothetical protein
MNQLKNQSALLKIKNGRATITCPAFFVQSRTAEQFR